MIEMLTLMLAITQNVVEIYQDKFFNKRSKYLIHYSHEGT